MYRGISPDWMRGLESCVCSNSFTRSIGATAVLDTAPATPPAIKSAKKRNAGDAGVFSFAAGMNAERRSLPKAWPASAWLCYQHLEHQLYPPVKIEPAFAPLLARAPQRRSVDTVTTVRAEAKLDSQVCAVSEKSCRASSAQQLPASTGRNAPQHAHQKRQALIDCTVHPQLSRRQSFANLSLKCEPKQHKQGTHRGEAALTGAVADALSKPAKPASLYICDDSILAACRTTGSCWPRQ